MPEQKLEAKGIGEGCNKYSEGHEAKGTKESIGAMMMCFGGLSV